MTLVDIQKRNNFKTDKGSKHSYLGVYDELFLSYRYQRINFLEVGVARGGSIALWKRYFKNGTINGLDMKLKVHGNGLFECDSRTFVPTAMYDIIIDDGSHKAEEQAETFKNLHPYCRGLYVIEDVGDEKDFDMLSNLHEKCKGKIIDLRKIKNKRDDVLIVYDLSEKGEKSMVTIIADIGINHHGNMGMCRKMIADASEAGADICKFQWYDCDSLFGDPTKDTYNKDIYEKVKPFELDEKKIEQLMKWCDLERITFGCSVFDHERFLKLDAMGVQIHKIASRVSKHDRPLALEILQTGKICYASLGFGADPFDIIAYPNCRQLLCVSNYPTEYSDIHFPDNFKNSIYKGFSSHCMNAYPSLIAIARGAEIVEVHFTLDKGLAALPGGFDHISSLDKSELIQLVKFAREAERIL